MLTIRLDPLCDKLFSMHQSAFIKKRDIADGVLSLHELMHHCHVKKRTGIVLKLDFEKAYDKVNWDFLIECHRARGFVRSGVLGFGGFFIMGLSL